MSSECSQTRTVTPVGDIESQTPEGPRAPTNISEKVRDRDPYEVILEHEDNPQNRSKIHKWIIIIITSSAALCVACASSVASFTELGVSRDLHVSKEATILAISLYVFGLGLGPLLVGPLSEAYGRSPIYSISFFFFFIFNFPVTFAPNFAVYLVFRFITGFCGSAFLSVAGGTASDLFDNQHVGTPMAVYTVSPFIGPVLGPLISGFINEYANWRWMYRVQLIWIFFELLALVLLVPETYTPVILKNKAQTLRKSTGDEHYFAPLERVDQSVIQKILFNCKTPFLLMLHDRMALLLNLWTSLLLGILYLTFQAFPVIFEENHGFTMGQTGLSFLGIGLGMIIGVSTQPLWNRIFKRANEKYNGHPPPEVRLYQGQIGGILVPIGLISLAFTTYPHVHWIAPIICSIPFGTGCYFVFTTTFTYLVVAYRPIAASAMASNSAMRSTFAAVFPLFAPYMYQRLGPVGATSLLAGLSALMAPLPFIFFKIGARLREKSKYAA